MSREGTALRSHLGKCLPLSRPPCPIQSKGQAQYPDALTSGSLWGVGNLGYAAVVSDPWMT